MRILLVNHEDGLRLLRIPGEPAIVDTIPIHTCAEGARVLSVWQHDATSMSNLRAALAADDAHLPTSLTDYDAIQLAADRVATRRLGLIRFNRLRHAVVEAGPSEAPPPASTAKKKALTWIEFVVVKDETGEPIPWVSLEITLPTGEKVPRTTDRDGLIRIDDIEPGTCDVISKFENLRLPTTFNYLTLGGSVAKAGAPAQAGQNGQNGQTDTRVKRIAWIEAHKVSTGERIDTIAKDAGMTWQDLAKFNWGTDVPDEINKHLRDEVGCTQKTADKNNYIFTSADNPGIVYVPHFWSEESLSTGCTHIIRVGTTKVVQRAWLGVQIFFHRMPIKDLVVQFFKADDSDNAGEEIIEPTTDQSPDPQKLRTDDDGIARHAGKVEIGNYICRIENQLDAHITTVSDEKDATMLVLPIGRPHYEYDAAAIVKDAERQKDAQKQQEVGSPTAPEA